MKKILFVNSSLSGGGSERVMTLLANQMSDNGYEVIMLLILEGEIVYQVNEKVKCIQLKQVKGSFAMRVSRILQIRKYIDIENPDVVISFMSQINIYTLLACIGKGKKVIVSERANPLKRKRRLRIIENILYRWFATGIVFQTDYAKKCYSINIQKKAIVIPNPVNKIKRNTSSIKRQMKIVSIGRMTEQKNFTMLINAYKKFLSRYPEYNLYIYGDGPLKQSLINQCEELKIREKVFFPGYVKNLSDRIYDASMYISSSNFEGISNAMLEAMSLGIPSICTDCPVGGAKMIIENGINGVLIPVNNEIALVEAMEKVAGDSKFANLISNEAMNISEKYSLQEITRIWEFFLERSM